MFIMLRSGLPFDKTWGASAFFAFGVFGHCWTWFHLFLPVIEFTGILHAGLIVGLIGATGVFAGTLAYEVFAASEGSQIDVFIDQSQPKDTQCRIQLL